MTKDAVCGMQVDEVEAGAAGFLSECAGRTYFFCSTACKRAFEADRQRFVDHGHETTLAEPRAPDGKTVERYAG